MKLLCLNAVRYFLVVLIFSNFLFTSGKISQTRQKLRETKEIINLKKKEKQICIDKQRNVQEELKKIELELKKTSLEKKNIENKIYQTKLTISALENNLKLLSSDMDFYTKMLVINIREYIEREYITESFIENNFEKRLKKDIFREFSKQIIKIRETFNYTEDLKREYEEEKKKLSNLNNQLEQKKQQQISLYKKKGELLNELKLKQKEIDKEIAELNKTQKELEDLLRKLYKEEKEKQARLQKEKEMKLKEKKVVKTEKRFIKPIEGAIVCKFGKSKVLEDGRYIVRNGVVIQGMSNSDVLCVDDGKVLFVSNNFRSYGKIVIVEHRDNIHTIYANLGEILVVEGSWVRRSTPIARTDNSGQLYFEIRKDLTPVDPELFFE